MNYGSSSEYEDAAIELLRGGKPQQALETFQDGLRKFPEDPSLLLGCGMALNDLKRSAEAREAFIRVIEKTPDLTDALQGLAEAEIALGNTKAAAEAARKACDRCGEEDVEFVHHLAQLLYRHRLFADAEHCYRRAVAIDRAHGLSWVGLASSIHFQGRHDEAIRVLKDAVEDRLPGCWEAYSYLGCLLCDAGRVDEAIRLLNKIPLDELHDPSAVRRLRAYLDREKNPERAKVLSAIEKRAAAALRLLGHGRTRSGGTGTRHRPHRLPPRREPFQGTFVVGPVYGKLTGLKRILRHAGLIDADGTWLGRNANLIVAGPILREGGRRLDALRYLMDIRGSGTSEHGKVEIVLSPHDAAILRGLGKPFPLGCRWAAEAGDHLVTAGGVLPEVIARVCKERPHPSWRSGGGLIRAPTLMVLSYALREEEIGGVTDNDWEPEYPGERQVFTCDMGPGVTGLENGSFVRLNSGLRATGNLYYVHAYGCGEKPRCVEVPPGRGQGCPSRRIAASESTMKIKWVSVDDVGRFSGHGINFHHAATGRALIAFAAGYPRGMGCGCDPDEVTVYLRKTRPDSSEPISSPWRDVPTAPAEMAWNQIVSETKCAVEEYFNKGTFRIKGYVWTVIGG